jgi:antirestriction protein ArdC
MNKDKVDVYQAITDKIIAELEKGVAPWLAPWNSEKARRLGGDGPQGWAPKNAISGRRYNGINVFLCWLHMSEHGLDTSNAAYLTYRQCQQYGGHVKAGSKACQIVLWKDYLRTEMIDGQQVKKKALYATQYNVFHLGQTEGVSLPEVAPLPEVKNLTDDAAWIDFIAKTKADLRHGGDRAYYAMKADYIQMPVAESFRSAEHYKATALHELTHWTGHDSRMKREFGRRFGDNAYAVEELVAELGAAFLCADHGIANPEMRHAAYIETWLRALKQDNRVIMTASSQAQKAAAFIDALVSGNAEVPAQQAA